MSEHFSPQELQQRALVVEAPARTQVDRNFGLPTGIYVATVGLYLAFIATMAGLFLNPGLVIPMVIFAGFIVMAFGLAGSWATMKPDNSTRPLTWGQMASQGIDTLSGRLSAHEAAVQVLMLPVLIVGWGLAIAVIVALT